MHGACGSSPADVHFSQCSTKHITSHEGLPSHLCLHPVDNVQPWLHTSTCFAVLLQLLTRPFVLCSCLGTTVLYNITVTNTGNVGLRSVKLQAPLLLGASPETFTCTRPDNTQVTLPAGIPAGSKLDCGFSLRFGQSAIEKGDFAPTVNVTAANLASPVTHTAAAVTIPNTPAMTVALNVKTCNTPATIGKCSHQHNHVAAQISSGCLHR